MVILQEAYIVISKLNELKGRFQDTITGCFPQDKSRWKTINSQENSSN